MSKIIFVVDASDQRAGTLRKAAEYLHDIFTHPKINDLAPPVLIACNKSELPNALTPQAIRTAFEKEL
jgi:signal recognition particle receptor subunit beta